MNKQEIKYIISAGLFGLVWFILVFPRILNAFDSPLTEFLIFNVGVYVFLFIFLKAIITSTQTNLKISFGLICLFLALDVYLPEYHVGLNGELLSGALLGRASTDYILGYIATNSLHLSGILVYLITYIIAPIILLILSAKLLPNFVRNI